MGSPITKVISDMTVIIYNLYLYVRYFIQTFFDGVQARVASGVKASEVGYQLAFSKQELRKVISQYPGSAVRIFKMVTFFSFIVCL